MNRLTDALIRPHVLVTVPGLLPAPDQRESVAQALGWHVATLHTVEMVWENGQTAGYRAFIGFVPKKRIGVVVLSNSANTIDDIGVHILDKDSPLRPLHREAEIKPAQLGADAGIVGAADLARGAVPAPDGRAGRAERAGRD